MVMARATTYAIRSCRQPGVHCLPESSVGSPSSTPAGSLAHGRSRRSPVSRATTARLDGVPHADRRIGNQLGDIDWNQSAFREHGKGSSNS